jgi:hypothetical protein
MISLNFRCNLLKWNCKYQHLSGGDSRTALLSPAEKIVVEARSLVSILYFPLLLKGDPISAFIVRTTKGVRELTNNEIDLYYILSFQVSLALANARLYEKANQAIIDLNQAYDATLEGWSRVLDMRDHITDAHTHRVADLTVSLATKMGVPEPEMAHIRRTAYLHDIGGTLLSRRGVGFSSHCRRLALMKNSEF